MKNLIEHMPAVSDAFFGMTAAIRENVSLSKKELELVLIGVFTAARAPKGLHTHIARAFEAGANKKDIISCIVAALPAIGVAKVNEALDYAMPIIEQHETKCSLVD